VALVLDPVLPLRPSEREEGLLELAISIAATGVADLTRRGQSRLTVAIAGRPPQILNGPASPRFCQEVLRRLAELPADSSDSLARGLPEFLAAAPSGARIIVISPRPADDPAFAAHSAELPLDPDDLVWIDAGSSQLGELIVLE
jgi:hypothetical protein